MNPNQYQHLRTLQDYYATHHVLPTQVTLTRLWKMSRSSVARLWGKFKEWGYLATTPDGKPKPAPRFFERALCPAVRAGEPSMVEGDFIEQMRIDDYLVEQPSRTLLIRVKGDSMQEAGIQDGDIAVVEQTQQASHGAIVVAQVDGEFTLKYLQLKGGQPILQPANSAYAPIIPRESLQIIGVVTGLFRRYH